MLRLQSELPLSAEQLQDVFDSLDDDANGYLTLEEFTGGFGESRGARLWPVRAARRVCSETAWLVTHVLLVGFSYGKF